MDFLVFFVFPNGFSMIMVPSLLLYWFLWFMALLLFIVFVSHVVRGLPDQAVPYDCMLWFLKAFFVMFFYQ